MNIFKKIKQFCLRFKNTDNLVLKEAQNLNKFATKEELDKLEIEILDPDSIQNCIYGQITGSCFSLRAQELIEQCCERVYNVGEQGSLLDTANLNGSPKGKRRRDYWSPIEVFIWKNRKNRFILAELVRVIKEGK